MEPPFPSPVATWHNDVYPAIDPESPELSHKGHTVIVTGAGGGIGRQTAIAFDKAGARRLVLVGRTESSLQETKALVSEQTETSVFTADVTDAAAIQKVADAVGTWDVLVLNAGYMNAPAYVSQTDVDDYWKSYEINVKSIIIAAKAFFPNANSERAAVLAPVGGSLVLPTKMLVGLSGYLVAKLAVIKTMEYLALENPNIFCASLHPGMVDTGLFRKSGATPDMLPMDNASLAAGFMVWLTLPDAQFLNGKFVWANWDVDELKAQKDNIASGTIMTAGIDGWPFSPA